MVFIKAARSLVLNGRAALGLLELVVLAFYIHRDSLDCKHESVSLAFMVVSVCLSAIKADAYSWQDTEAGYFPTGFACMTNDERANFKYYLNHFIRQALRSRSHRNRVQ